MKRKVPIISHRTWNAMIDEVFAPGMAAMALVILLGGIYSTRSLALAWYFMAPPTPTDNTISSFSSSHQRRRRSSPRISPRINSPA